MHLVKVVALAAIVSHVTAVGTPTVSRDNGITCIPGEFMCIVHAKDWAGPDEIWTCNAQGDLVLSAICGGRNCCQDSGSGVKCVC